MTHNYIDDVCPFCEKPIAGEAQWTEYDKRLVAAHGNEHDAELTAWADAWCWNGWANPGTCRNGMFFDDRLIEVLQERDALKAELQAYKQPAQFVGQSADMPYELQTFCARCGNELELVRPGKWQCNVCEAQP